MPDPPIPDPPIPDPPIPWVGLAAMAARFLLLSLPDWLFAGPRTIKRRPRRHICGDCGGPWTDKQTCTLEASNDDPPLWGELRRLAPPADLLAKNCSLVVPWTAVDRLRPYENIPAFGRRSRSFGI